jgi:hypothetical protein
MLEPTTECRLMSGAVGMRKNLTCTKRILRDSAASPDDISYRAKFGPVQL